MYLLDADVYKLICTLPFSQGFALSQYLEKYSHSTEGISWVYLFELIFSPFSLCLFRTLLLIPLKYILISENHSNLLVSNTKQRFWGWEGRCHSQICQNRDTVEKLPKTISDLFPDRG